MTTDDIIADQPRLTVDHICAARACAADDLADEEIVYG
jgi:hypothetical protein